MVDFIRNASDLRRSVISFMKPNNPEKWKKACATRYKYFVHYKKNRKPLFGLSKFCAFKDIALDRYINGLRRTTDGTTTQKHISKCVQKKWVHINKAPCAIRQDFYKWARPFLKTVDDRDIFLMLLD